MMILSLTNNYKVLKSSTDLFCLIAGHKNPSYLHHLGLNATYSTTLLRDPVDFMVHINLDSLCKYVLSRNPNLQVKIGRGRRCVAFFPVAPMQGWRCTDWFLTLLVWTMWQHQDASLAERLFHACQPYSNKTRLKNKQQPPPTSHPAKSALVTFPISNSPTAVLPFDDWHWVSQVDWVRSCKRPPSHQKSRTVHRDSTTFAGEKTCGDDPKRKKVAEASIALSHMPWFGILRHWVGSTCLWHFRHELPFPYDENANAFASQNGGSAAEGKSMQVRCG